MEKGKFAAVVLIKKFFEPVTNREIIDCSSEDRIQLASAIAREQKIPVEDLSFTPVEY
jgi:hypothetical protein